MNKKELDEIIDLLFMDDLSISGKRKLTTYITDLQEENENLKYHLNDVVFDDNNEDVELAARLLRRLGYCDFDEEKKVYVNTHNNQPLMEEDIREKAFYLKDDELDDYTKQLENRLNKVIEYIGLSDKDKKLYDIYDVNGIEVLNILEGKEVKYDNGRN